MQKAKIEHLIEYLAGYNISGKELESDLELLSKDEKTIKSLGAFAFSYRPFTEKQAKLVLSILKRYKPYLSKHFSDIDKALDNPEYRLPLTISVKQVSAIFIEDDIIKISFSYDKKIIDIIKQSKYEFCLFNWNNEEKTWEGQLNIKNILLCKKIINLHNFYLEEEFKEYFDQTLAFLKENKKPTAIVKDNIIHLVNLYESQYEFFNGLQK